MANNYIELLVQTAMTFLLLPTGSLTKNTTTGLWLLNIRESQGVSIRPDGRILSSTSDPSLYNLFRVQTYQKGLASRLTFTLESMATNRFICMNPKGHLITQERTQPFPPGRKRKRSPPSDYCIFHSWSFGKQDWNQMIGIYMEAPRSNGTKGWFIAFNKNGHPRKYSQHFSKLHQFVGILISMHKPPSIRKLIRRTRFRRCDGEKGNRRFNRAVRRCLDSNPDLRHPNKVVRKNIFKVIQRCEREVEEEICAQKLSKLGLVNGGRRTLRQDSKQRNPFEDYPSYNKMEEGEDEPCRCGR